MNQEIQAPAPPPVASFDLATLLARLANERGADIVEALEQLEPAEAAQVLAALPADRAVEALDQTSFEDAHAVLALLDRGRAVALVAAMSADRVADVFHRLEEPARGELLGLLDAETRGAVERLLAYPEGSAGSIMTTEFVSVPATWTVAQVLHHIRMVERTRETVYAVYVLDPVRGTLVQAVSLRRLIAAEPDANVLSAAPPRRPIWIRAGAPREEAVRLIAKYDLLSVPVVDPTNHVIGIVTVDDVIDAIVARQTEQVQRFGGMEALDEPYTEIGFGKMLRKRAGWLCVLFVSEMLTASAMQGFQDELEKALVLALFIPLIMSSGGNSGSQATSLLIRALALHQVRLQDWWRVALRELPTGLALGALLGALGSARIARWQMAGIFDYGEHWVLVAATVGGALVGIVTFGSLAGSMLPFALQRVGFDPASASAPFVATLVDVAGIVIYFSVALVILRGTLL